MNKFDREYKRISAISRKIQTQSEEVEKLPYMKHIAGEVGSLNIKNNEKFPYGARTIQKAINNKSDLTTWIKNQINIFEWIEGTDYTLHSRMERVKGNKGGGAVEVHDYYLTEEAALQVALSARSTEAKAFAKHIIDNLQKIKATLKEIQEREASRDPMLELAKAYVKASETIEYQEKQLAIQAPKAEQYDLYINNGGYQKIGDVAKTLNIAPNTFHKMLRDAKILQENYVPYAEYKKYFHVVVTPLSGTNFFTSYIKPEGVSYLVKRFNLTQRSPLSLT